MLEKKNIVGIVLSGGPSSVYDQDAPHCSPGFWTFCQEKKIPVLGICYGMQEMQTYFGGKVEASAKREYGKALLEIPLNSPSPLLENVHTNNVVWMSHGDRVVELAPEFVVVGKSENCEFGAAQHTSKPLYGLQFHPEVTHTVEGAQILQNFCIGICQAPTDWNMEDIAASFIESVRATVGEHEHVIGAVSGGVDSSVAAVLLNRAIGKRFHAIMVDNGCLRLNEGSMVVTRLKEKENIHLQLVDESKLFFSELEGVEDPERKRQIIGKLFIDVFQREADKIAKSLPKGEKVAFLLQGTLYPDVIESISYKGPSAIIKSHHNVGGLPETMKLKLIEPLRELFKDEVRKLGTALGLDHSSVWRHPFPGPGLAIRILGHVTKERADTLRQADDIAIKEIYGAGVYDKISQAFVVLLPSVKSVGVMGDSRTYENACVVRCVTSDDFMTADWYQMDYQLLGKISSRIINEVSGINRVCYDVSSKPPATIEWE